ncbi:hypothetical protein ACFXKI_18385 [Streptomyces mirabilis]|uniref:hypothetical protein n=1 Tax=Streptomyces mirabilis TaxID=68239 RepID=UPI0036C8AB55
MSATVVLPRDHDLLFGTQTPADPPTHRPATDAPSLPECRPLACDNAAFTEANTAAWREQLVLPASQLTRADILPPLVRDRLTRRRDEIGTFLDRTLPANASEGST